MFWEALGDGIECASSTTSASAAGKEAKGD